MKKKTGRIQKVLKEVRDMVFPSIPDSMAHEVCHNADLVQIDKRMYRCRKCSKTWMVTGDDKHLNATWIPSL